MSRLLRMLLAAAALAASALLALAAADATSMWSALAAVVGVWVANLVAVQLTVAASRESNEVRQRRYAAYLHELDRAAEGRTPC